MKKLGKIINIKSFTKGDTLEKSLSGSSAEGKSYLFLWLIIIAVIVSITFILTPPFRSSQTVLDVGDISLKNIRANEDILVEDKVSTIKNKERAEESSPDIYDFDTKLTRDITNKVSAGFDLMAKFYKERLPDIYSYIDKEEDEGGIDSESLSGEAWRKLKREMAARLNKFENSDEFRAKEAEFQNILKIDLSDNILKILKISIRS